MSACLFKHQFQFAFENICGILNMKTVYGSGYVNFICRIIFFFRNRQFLHTCTRSYMDMPLCCKGTNTRVMFWVGGLIFKCALSGWKSTWPRKSSFDKKQHFERGRTNVFLCHNNLNFFINICLFVSIS